MKRNNFVKTRAVDEAIKIMESQNMVVLTGSAGSGKSATAIYLLRHFQITKNYQPLKILTFTDLSTLVKPNTDKPVIVLLEDIFGRTNYTYGENSDSNVLGELGTCIGNKLKVIITIRTTIMKSCMFLFYTSNVFCGLHVVDLSRDFQLVKEEKKLVLERYLDLNNITISECGNCMDDQLQPDAAVTISNKVIDEIVHLDTVGGFPENCRLFTTIRCFTRLGIQFFRHPTISLRTEIDALRRADGNDNISSKLKYKFTALVYMLLSNDVLSKKSLDFCKVQDIFRSVYGSGTIIEHQFIDAADDMVDQYLTYSLLENVYYFQHRIIAEAVMISYSKCNISQVISMLNPDFIAEMVKSECYKEKEGEVVFKVPSNNYRHLANVIAELLLLKSVGACFIEYILIKSDIFENVEFLYSIVETFEYLFEPDDSLSCKDIELKTRVRKLLDLTFKKTVTLNNLDCLTFIWKVFAKNSITTPSLVRSMCSVFVRVDKERNQMELLEWMIWNSNEMFIKQCLEKTVCYQSHFLESLLSNDTLITKMNEIFYSSGENNIQQIIINQACQINNNDIFFMLMRNYDKNINLEETFLKACCNDNDEVTFVEWLLGQYDLNRLNIKRAFENIYEFWVIYEHILKTLLKTSANDDNELSKMLLFAAFKTGNVESANFIIHRIDLRTFDFRSAVSMACNNHAYKIIEWLLEQSFFMQISSKIDDKPVLRIIKWRNQPESFDIRAVLNDSFLEGDYGMDLITDTIKYFRILAFNAFRFIAKSSYESQQSFVKSCHRTHFKIDEVFLDACKSQEFEVLEMVLNFYDECIYSPLITQAGEDFLGIDINKVSRFSKLPSAIFQNTTTSIIHRNVSLFSLVVKRGNLEKLKIFIRQVDHNKLKNHDEALGHAIDFVTLQKTELLLDSFPISAFDISGHLEKVIVTGNTDVFELILRKVDIHLLDIDQLLTVTITYGERKGLLLDILQRIYSQLNFKIYLEKQIVAALAVMDLEVFEFLLQHVDHENINAKRIVMKALQRNKFDIALLILGTVSVNLLEMEKEVVDELVNAIVCNDENYLRRFLMSCLNVNFDKMLTSAAKDGDVSIINDILCHHYAGITIDITECIIIAFQHKQSIVIKSLIEHTNWNLDLKLEFVDFLERDKTRICEFYLNFINIEDSQILNRLYRIRRDIYLDFRCCFVDDHMEHQYLSRLLLMDLLHYLFSWACYLHDNECIAMILINVSEDVVERLMTDTRFNISKDIFSYACSECKDGKLFNAKRLRMLSFAKKYGCLLNDTVSDEKA